MKSLGNKKGISSEDIFGKQEVKSEEVKQRFEALKGAKAISSDMFFGTEDKEEEKKNAEEDSRGILKLRASNLSKNNLMCICITGSKSYEEYKESASKMVEKAQEQASILKGKALDWLSTFTTH